jgi:RHS repeat-associated protein
VSTDYSYDFRGLLTSVTLAAGTSQQTTTVYAYDELGNEVSQTDAAGRITTFQYDALGHRIGRTLPGLQSEGMAYDLEGNPIYQTNFNGAVITNQYDLGNRLLRQASVNGYNVSYAYSPTGLRTNRVDRSGQTAYFYDAMSRLTNKMVAWTNGPVRSLSYGYDAYDTLTNLYSGTYGGVSNAYAYDLLGRLTNVLANGGAAAGYGFDALGNLQATRYGNGVTNLDQYDSLNHLTNEVWKSGATPLASFGYTLGPTGNRTALTETNNGTVRSYAWAYDSLYRLTGETLAGGTSGSLTYRYDVVGNRTNRTVTNISSPTSLTNQNAAFTANDWLTGDAYDNNGNTTNSSGNAYQYDALNHATNVNNGGILLAYDGDGNRAKKTVAATGTTTYYLLDDRNPSGYVQVLEEWTTVSLTTNLSKVYNYGLDLISQCQGAGGTISYYGTDGHGSTRFLANTSGTITDTYTYDAYGVLIASTGTTPNNYLYCCQQWDPDLGSYYNRARYLNQNTGRFWTMDTHEGNNKDPLHLHKYLYATDSPVDLIDPSGLDPEGHHLVPKMLWKKYSQRVKDVWDAAKNRLDAKGYKSHGLKPYKNISWKEYARAVQNKLDKYLESKGAASPEQLSDGELQEFANEIRNTTEGPIAEYNTAVAEEIEAAVAEGAEAVEIVGFTEGAIDVDLFAIDLGIFEL